MLLKEADTKHKDHCNTNYSDTNERLKLEMKMWRYQITAAQAKKNDHKFRNDIKIRG